MSIIYDALKKTQQARSESIDSGASSVANKIVKKKIHFSLIKAKLSVLTKSFLILGLLTLVLMLLLTAINHFSSELDAYLSKYYLSGKPNTEINLAKFKTNHLLNGVFVSDNETVAMINKTMYHRGDTVDGMTVSSIDTEGVQMLHDDQVLFLPMQS